MAGNRDRDNTQNSNNPRDQQTLKKQGDPLRGGQSAKSQGTQTTAERQRQNDGRESKSQTPGRTAGSQNNSADIDNPSQLGDTDETGRRTHDEAM